MLNLYYLKDLRIYSELLTIQTTERMLVMAYGKATLTVDVLVELAPMQYCGSCKDSLVS